jgi:hypothetical protein
MAHWYEVFDDEQVQLQTRQQVRRVVIGLVIVLSALAVAGPLIVAGTPDPAIALGGLAIAALVSIALTSRRLMRLQRVMWCVKLSVHRIVGFDYARRKIVLPWCEVERVEVDREGLLVVGMPGPQGQGPVLQIPSQYPDFHALSHRTVEYAEAHGIPICVDGRPWQLLDIAKLYPFLERPAAAERPGGFFFGSTESEE